MARRDGPLTIVGLARFVLWLVRAWVVIDLVLLLLAFVLRLFGANPTADFTQWVYRSVDRAMAPFRGIFEPLELTDRSVLDTSLLFAMIVYGIVALVLFAITDWLTSWMRRRRSLLAQEELARQYQASVVTVSVDAAPSAGGTSARVVVPQPEGAGSG